MKQVRTLFLEECVVMSFNLETLLQPYAYFIPLFGSLAVVILCLPFFIREFVRASRYSLEQAYKKANTFREVRSIRFFVNMIVAMVIVDIISEIFMAVNPSPGITIVHFLLLMAAVNILFLFAPILGLLLIWFVKRRISVLERRHQ